MKPIRISSALISLPLVAALFSCTHSDAKYPNSSQSSDTEPTFESEGAKTEIKTPATKVTDSRTANRSPNPLTGPGLETTVPLPTPNRETERETMPKPAETKTPATYNEALAAVDKAKEKDNNLRDYWIGAGYDMLTGNRLSICLDPESLRTIVTNTEEVSDTYSVAHDYRELYAKLETEFGPDIGGIWQIFSGKLSFKTKIARETRMAQDDIVVMTSFTRSRNRIRLQTPGTEHAPYFRSVGLRDKKAFRKYCGDKFTKTVSIGASMHLVFTAKKIDDSSWEKNDVEAAIKAGLSGFRENGPHIKVSEEQKAILKSYAFTAKCYALGATPGLCGSYGASTAFDINSDLSGFQKTIEDLRARMIEEVQEGKNLVVVKEAMADYEVPGPADENDDELAKVKRWDYFVDYRDRVGKLKRMSLDKMEANEICTQTPSWSQRCDRVNALFDEASAACMSFERPCTIPRDKEFKMILTAKDRTGPISPP